MANFYAQYPAASAGSANASVGPNGVLAPTSSTEIAGVGPTGNLTPVSVDSSGNVNTNIVSGTLPLPTGAATAANQVLEINDLDALNARLAGALVPAAFNEIDLTYITSGNGTGQIGTATYKLAAATVKTLTLTYDASNRLSSVVAS